MRRRVIVDEPVDLISTGDFLHELEATHLIQSTDRVLDVATEAGSNMQRQRETTSDESVRGVLQAQLRKTEEASANDFAGRTQFVQSGGGPTSADGDFGDEAER